MTAFKILSDENVSKSQMLIAGSLLSKDFSGRLGKDETTEKLEEIKAVPPNPIFASIDKIIETIKK
ncbi:MAG: hypothetical protein O6940_11410 [Ignavibacteria bacterium]|nr:hypothetical protein [Ignavibacteria bacterium]